MEDKLQTERNQESEVAIAEVIYSDQELIDSLDSQWRSGTLDSEESEHGKSTTAGGKGGFSLPGIVKIGGTKEKGVSDKSARRIRPHDYKARLLMSDLEFEVHTKGADLNGSNEHGRLRIVQGDAQLFSLEYLTSILETGDSANIFQEQKAFVYKTGPNDWKNGKNQLEVVRYMLQLMPSAPCLFLTLDDGLTLLTPLIERNLRYPIEVLFETFPGGQMGKWITFGILRPTPIPCERPDTFIQEGINVQIAVSDLLETGGYPLQVFTPIHIYQQVDR